MPHILEERAKQWTEDWLAQGRSEGQRLLLAQQAQTRFGVEASARLSEALDNGGGATLAELADLIVTCANAEEFTARLKGGTGGSA